MARPANQHSAARAAHALLVRRLPGSRRGSVRAHLQRAVRIADRIWRRWQVGPYQWQVKHLRWYLAAQARGFTPGPRYRYWLTVRALVFALGQAFIGAGAASGGVMDASNLLKPLLSSGKLRCIIVSGDNERHSYNEPEYMIDALVQAGALIARGRLKHQYPHSWRSKKPVIFRNTPQWFVYMDKSFQTDQVKGDATLRDLALDHLALDLEAVAGQVQQLVETRVEPLFIVPEPVAEPSPEAAQ